MPTSLGENFSVAVIGAGVQGAELALLSIRAGFRTIVEDVFPSKLRSLSERLQQEFATEASSIIFANSIEDAVRDADFAMDSVPDELESKLEIFSLLDRMAPPRTIICSPLEAVSLSDLASCTYRAPLCIGVQPMNGSFTECHVVRLVRGTLTSDETADKAKLFWHQVSKQVHLVHDAALPEFGA